MQHGSVSRERLERPPGQVYTETILEPSHLFMVEHYFQPLLDVNKAWAVMLHECGIVPSATSGALVRATLDLERDGPSAILPFNPAYEYFYTHVERFLTDRIGEEAAGEINIGRTRPEPLARMVTRQRILDVLAALGALRTRLLDLAQAEADTVMPQWTHQQPAQPSTFGHYALAIADALSRDARRLIATYDSVNRSTLGCGALAGSSYPLDRDLVAELLGFDGLRLNTIDCVSGADHMLESASTLANLLITLSRLCQDLYTWSTWECGFVEIGDEYAGSSSLMPQKKNAYPFEYARARAAHAVGEMAGAFGTLHNTNYQDLKDVEEEVASPVLRCFDLADGVLRLLEGTLSTLEVKRQRMAEAAWKGFSTSTELAAVIHRANEGLSYRTAHRIVGHLVGEAVRRGLEAPDVDAALVQTAAGAVLGHSIVVDDDMVRRSLDPQAFVESHSLPGGPAPGPVRAAIAEARGRLDGDTDTAARLAGRLAEAKHRLDARAAALAGEPPGERS